MFDLSQTLEGSISKPFKSIGIPAKLVLMYFVLFADPITGEVECTVNHIVRFCGESGRMIYAGLYELRDVGLLEFEGDIISGQCIRFRVGDF